MNFLSKIIHSILLLTTFALIAQPIDEILPIHHRRHQQVSIPDLRTLSYDEVVDLLALIEADSHRETYSLDQLDQVNQFISFLAMEGATDAEKPDMAQAVASLYRKDDIQYALFIDSESDYTAIPAIYLESSPDIILCKSWFKKQWKATKDFVKKHKKAIIIGAIVAVTVTVVVVAAVAISTSAATAAAAHALSSTANNESLAISLQSQVSSFKETIAQEQLAAAPEANGISLEENGRIIGSLFAHQTIDTLTAHCAQNPSIATELQYLSTLQYPAPAWLQDTPITPHPSTDLAFSTNYTPIYPNTHHLNSLSYQTRAAQALSSECYTQALHDFNQAINIEPNNPTLYLERGITHFELGNYQQSIYDYTQYIEKKDEPFSVTDFSLGFVQGVPKGVYESGEGALLFLSEFITHPVHTSKQVVDSLSQLATLVKNDELGILAEALSPELHQLVTQWETLPSQTKGELAGYAVGKLGADILTPGAIAKVTSKSINSAKELVAICKNLRLAQETLILETASGIGNSVKVAEIVKSGKTKLTFGEGLGAINKEIKLSTPGLTPIQERIFLSSASEKYNEHLTQLAHALSKHSGRKNTFWIKPTGPMNTWHAQAVKQLEHVCNAPGEFNKVFDPSTGLIWIEKRLPNGKGIRLNQDYTFKGFLD